MQTQFHPEQLERPEVREADKILRSCVHCGFCNAVCPTYQQLGDELDGPRGRIYLIKTMLEEERASLSAIAHIDRCLTCRACESACPSGVKYAKLLDIGREHISNHGGYSFYRRLLNLLLSQVVPFPKRMGFLVGLGRMFSLLLPPELKSLLGQKASKKAYPVAIAGDPDGSSQKAHQRVILLEGCVQKVTTPGVNIALERILALAGIESIRMQEESCCGALDYHLPRQKKALWHMRSLIDQLWPYVVDQTVIDQKKTLSAIISSASGCGVTIKSYSDYFEDDDEYREKATIISSLVKDACEVVTSVGHRCKPMKVALQSPCSLQHGQKLDHHLQELLVALGFELVEVPESHMCCGSAGAYSLMQPGMASQLRQRKLRALLSSEPDVIVTANIGCQLHLSGGKQVGGGQQEKKKIPVMHWLELVEQSLI